MKETTKKGKIERQDISQKRGNFATLEDLRIKQRPDAAHHNRAPPRVGNG